MGFIHTTDTVSIETASSEMPLTGATSPIILLQFLLEYMVGCMREIIQITYFPFGIL